jgi:methyl-accepting chemotaxis protein
MCCSRCCATSGGGDSDRATRHPAAAGAHTHTARATEEIRALVAAIQEATHQTVSDIAETDGAIASASDTATVIAAAVEEQDAATREIARGIENAAKSSGEVAASARDSGGAALLVLRASEAAAEQSRNLRLAVDRFLDAVRAA